MINGILNGLLNFVIFIIGVLVSPIDSLINSTLPQFSDLLTNFGSLIDKLLEVIPWVLSWFHIPGYFIVFICSYLIAKLTMSVVVHEIKLILAWYRKIMP